MPSLASLLAPSPPVKSSVPFAALPHALVGDPRLNTRAVVLAAVLLRYARDKASCWPSNARLAADMGCTIGTVKNGLRRLLAAGWVAAEGGANPTGRLLRLAWRGGAKSCPPPGQSPDPGGGQPIAPEASLEKEGEKERPSSDEGSSSPSPTAGDKMEDDVAQALAWVSSGNPTLAATGRIILRMAGVPSEEVGDDRGRPERCQARPDRDILPDDSRRAEYDPAVAPDGPGNIPELSAGSLDRRDGGAVGDMGRRPEGVERKPLPYPAPEPPPAQVGPMPPALQNKGSAGDHAPETADRVPCPLRNSATQPRGDAGTRPVAPAAPQVPRPVAPTMSRGPGPQRRGPGPAHSLGEILAWPLTHPPAGRTPPRRPAGPSAPRCGST